MLKFSEIVNDPDYAQLSPEDQFKVRQGYFQQHVGSDPDFQNLPDADRQAIGKSILFPEAKKDESLFGKLKSGEAFAGKTGAVVEGALNVARQIGGAPEKTVENAAAVAPTFGRNPAADELSKKLQLTGLPQGIADPTAGVITIGRALGGAMFAPFEGFIPRVLLEKGGEAATLIGKTAASGARKIGLPEAIPTLIEEFTPDALFLAVGARLHGATELNAPLDRAFSKIEGRAPTGAGDVAKLAKDRPQEYAKAFGEEVAKEPPAAEAPKSGSVNEIPPEQAAPRFTAETPVEDLFRLGIKEPRFFEEPAANVVSRGTIRPEVGQGGTERTSTLTKSAQNETLPGLREGVSHGAKITGASQPISEIFSERAATGKSSQPSEAASIAAILKDPDFKALSTADQAEVLRAHAEQQARTAKIEPGSTIEPPPAQTPAAQIETTQGLKSAQTAPGIEGPAPGMVRLYRGQFGDFQPLEEPQGFGHGERGRWFTTDKDLAEFHGKDVYYVDVPKEVADMAREPDSLFNESGRLLPRELANQAKKLPQEAPAPTVIPEPEPRKFRDRVFEETPQGPQIRPAIAKADAEGPGNELARPTVSETGNAQLRRAPAEAPAAVQTTERGSTVGMREDPASLSAIKAPADVLRKVDVEASKISAARRPSEVAENLKTAPSPERFQNRGELSGPRKPELGDIGEPSLSDLHELYNHAAENVNRLAMLTDGLRDIKGVRGVALSIKEAEIAAEKILRKRSESGRETYGPRDLNDIVRGRITVGSPADIPRVIDHIEAGGNVAKVDNYFDSPKANGYRGVHLDIKQPDGTVSELQIHTPESYKASAALHSFYKKVRTQETPDLAVDGLMKRVGDAIFEGRKPDPKIVAELDSRLKGEIPPGPTKSGAKKPVSDLFEKSPTAAELKAEADAIVQDLGAKELVKKALGTETGAVGQLTVEQQRGEAIARAARSELYRRIEREAELAGVSFNEAALRFGLTGKQTAAIQAEQAGNLQGNFPLSRLEKERGAPVSQKQFEEIPDAFKGSRLNTATTEAITRAATDFYKENGLTLDKDIPISLQIARDLAEKKLPLDGLRQALASEGVTMRELADGFLGTATNAGRQLNQLAQVQKKLLNVLKDAKDVTGANELIDTIKGPPPTAWEYAGSLFRRWLGIWKGLLVSQLSTTVRNLETQGLRVGVEAIEKIADSAVRKIFRVGTDAERTFGEGAERAIEILKNVASSKQRALADKILEEFPEQKDRLFQQYTVDVERATPTDQRGLKLIGKKIDQFTSGGEKVAELANTLNSMQEYLFRRASFRARLAEELRAKGQDIERIDPKAIDVQMIERAVDHGLDMTFATTPKNGLGGAIMQVYRAAPVLGLIAPFPRFMVNSWRTFLDFSPAGFLKLLSPTERAKIAQGDVKTISRAVIGTGLLFTAGQIRNSEYAGERWYELQVNGKTIDARPFNPFATYLFVADTIKKALDGTLDKLTFKDLSQGLFSANFRAGTGLFMLDKVGDVVGGLFANEPAENAKQALKEATGQFAAGFLTPIQTLTDIISDERLMSLFGAEDFAREEAKVRETRGSPLTGPARTRIPGLSQTLPEKQYPLGPENAEREEPLAKQFTGLLLRSKTPAQHEADRLGLTLIDLQRPVGIPEFDRLVAEKVRPKAEEKLGKIIESASYEKRDDLEKRIQFKTVMGKLVGSAKKAVLADHPEFREDVKVKAAGGDRGKLLKRRFDEIKARRGEAQ